MKNVTLALALGTAVVTTVIGLSTNPAHAIQFKFDGLLSDGDLFNLTMITEDTLTTINAPSYSNPGWDPLAEPNPVPAYTFTGYTISSVSGTFTELGGTPNPIVGFLTAGSGVFNAPVNGVPTPDRIGHSPSDNLYNPNGGFASGVLPAGNKAGNFSFGGLVFQVQEGTEIENYQIFTRSDFNSSFNRPGDYGGCPGSCEGVVSVPWETGALPVVGSTVLFGLGVWTKRKLKPSKSSEKNNTKNS
jgi:hypothetical protein